MSETIEQIEQLRNLSEDEVRSVAKEYGTPVQVIDEATIVEQAEKAKAFPTPQYPRKEPEPVLVRAAMKANPHGRILQLVDRLGLHIDASSGNEAERAMRAGIDGEKILLTSQELPDREQLIWLIGKGVLFNATSLHQLDEYGRVVLDKEKFPNREVSVRCNAGMGSGHSGKTNVGGKDASFGIWHEYMDDALAIAEEHDLVINRLHTHIGSGADPDDWAKVAEMSLEQVAKFDDVTILNLGGGLPVKRMSYETEADINQVGMSVKKAIEDWYRQTYRTLSLEIEPGTFLFANSGSLIKGVIDEKDTGATGRRFTLVDSGMTENARPTLYGSEMPEVVVPHEDNKMVETADRTISGHCCESGDSFTTKKGQPDEVGERMIKVPTIGDLLVTEGIGAYGTGSMSLEGYCSFYGAPVVLRKAQGKYILISRRGNLEDLTAREL